MSSLKTVIFRSIGDIILIQLLGLAALNPFKSYSIDKGNGSFEVTFSMYMLVFLLYLIFYSITSTFIYKRRKERLVTATEVIEDDEMMLNISRESATAAYFTMKTVGIVIIGLFVSINIFYEIGIIKTINNYKIGVYSIVSLISLSIISYLIKWVLEYRRNQI